MFEIEDTGENFILLKTKKHAPGVEYTIEIQGIKDADGNVKDVLYGAFIVPFPTRLNPTFQLQKIEPVNGKSVAVFTHPVNINSENIVLHNIR